MTNWLVRKVLGNPLFLLVVVEIVAAVTDRKLDDDERDRIRQRVIDWLASL